MKENQMTVNYGKNVEKYEAIDAIRRFKPKIVIGSWVTHKYNYKFHYNGGFQYGIREDVILDKVDKYIFIGNEYTHEKKLILKDNPPTRTYKFPWLVSRSGKKDKNVIWIWEKEKK